MERFLYSHQDLGHDAGNHQSEQDRAIALLVAFYPHASALITSPDTTPPPVPELRAVFAAMTHDSDAQKQLLILEELFSRRDMGNVFQYLKTSWRMDKQQVTTVITGHERFAQITQALLPHQDTYRFPLGVLLAHYTQTTLPDAWKAQLHPHMLANVMKPSLTERIPEWYLCNASEQYLLKAMDDTAVTNVSDVLLVKHVGRLAGLCVMNATSTEGTFVRGNWYAPIETDLRQRLRDAHDSGTARLSDARGTWTVMRSVINYAGIDANDIVNQAEDCLISLPEQLPGLINYYRRGEYRREHEENY
jgi:hypothetical protein